MYYHCSGQTHEDSQHSKKASTKQQKDAGQQLNLSATRPGILIQKLTMSYFCV
jgi:hypothetical protein